MLQKSNFLIAIVPIDRMYVNCTIEKKAVGKEDPAFCFQRHVKGHVYNDSEISTFLLPTSKKSEKKIEVIQWEFLPVLL